MQTIISKVPNDRAETPIEGSGGGLHILIADDDRWIREAIAELFQREGYSVSTAEDGEAAYAILCEKTVDLLITDEDMPRLRGVELLRRLRQENSPLPAILISGCLPWNEPDLDDLLKPGFALEKPFAFSQLLKEVQVLSAATQAGVK
ncbi:MAG: response regulator [Nibricoccus sp.]